MHNDNFLDMTQEYDREVYEWLKMKTLQCRHVRRNGQPCYCAYGHQKGICTKCGHYTPQLMLPPSPLPKMIDFVLYDEAVYPPPGWTWTEIEIWRDGRGGIIIW